MLISDWSSDVCSSDLSSSCALTCTVEARPAHHGASARLAAAARAMLVEAAWAAAKAAGTLHAVFVRIRAKRSIVFGRQSLIRGEGAQADASAWPGPASPH